MATGDRCSNAAEELHRLAEQRFVAGDLAGALRAAREDPRRAAGPRSLALAAYEVHAAAAMSRASGRNWYAVLSVGARTSLSSDGVTHEDVKRRYRRLCLVLHPDKNPSAAADGAFKLLQEAWTALSARHPPAPAARAKPPRPVPTPSPAAPASAARPSSSNHTRRAPPHAASSPKESNRRRAGAGDTFSSRNTPRPPPRAFRNVFCGHCGQKFYAGADGDHEEEELCMPCRERPWEDPTRPAGEDADADADWPPPPPPQARWGSRRFPCPARCAHCGAGFESSTVSVGMWNLHCSSCHRYARVYVRGPYNAEVW